MAPRSRKATEPPTATENDGVKMYGFIPAVVPVGTVAACGLPLGNITTAGIVAATTVGADEAVIPAAGALGVKIGAKVKLMSKTQPD